MKNADINILVLEDEEDLNDAYSLILKKEGFNVASGKNGEDGIDLIKSFKPDLLLLDLRMPKMDGISFLKNSDFSNHFPQAKIVIFTNFDINDEINTAFELGAHRYVMKASLTPMELIKLVETETSSDD